MIKNVLRFGTIARDGVRAAETRPEFRVVLELKSALERFDSVGRAAALRVGAAEKVVVEPVIRIEVDRATSQRSSDWTPARQ